MYLVNHIKVVVGEKVGEVMRDADSFGAEIVHLVLSFFFLLLLSLWCFGVLYFSLLLLLFRNVQECFFHQS